MSNLKSYRAQICHKQIQTLKVNARSEQEARQLIESNDWEQCEAGELIAQDIEINYIQKEEK